MNNAKNSRGFYQVDAEGRDGRQSARYVVVVVLVAIVIAILGMLSYCGRGGWYDDSARQGSYAGKTEAEIIADLNNKVEAGMMNISCASVMRGEAGSRHIVGNLENSGVNTVDQKFVVTIKDTEEVLYESKAIAPGHIIDEWDMNRTMDEGSYDVVVTVTGYDPETHAQKGSLAGEVKLVIT